jgi:ArsR family transcriptional regulator, arsenate/arsenite/antimonite-responsive transcriptional repressor
LSREEAESLGRRLKILADPARLRLLTLVASKDNGEARVRDVTAALGLAQPTVSHHIGVLVSAGLLEKRRRDRTVYYGIVADPFEWLRAGLPEPQATTAAFTRRPSDQGKGITPLPTVQSSLPAVEGEGGGPESALT